MNISYPHTIENCMGEKIIFHEVQHEGDGDRIIVENFVSPGARTANAYALAAG
jgi:hypothetical protein